MTNYRKLNDSEISRLTAQGCVADDWSQVLVAEGFVPETVTHVRFSGQVRLGVFEKNFALPGGLTRRAGLHHVALHNCTVGNNTFIEGVANYIANYRIGDDCYIQNVNLLLTEGESSFGNGTEVSVLNETGGREVPIYNRLSAQMAYLMAMYRHRPDLIGRLRQLVADYTATVTSDCGTIGRGVHIVNTGTIRNLCIGDACRIDGASRLDNGTINSCPEAPVTIGANVTAQDFIISSGACVSDGAVLSRCFVGQACHLSHLFSAHDSLFFSNCQGENGEACAIFAGPYTVTMHKSSLLIAGMFSFLNAGSGSNQSNHMYKLGPIHQGVAERGAKTTSNSYLLWPAKIGTFTLVMGRHTKHSDTSDMPFSYLIENATESYLVPAVNLRSVGTIRDAQKWPKRDARKDSCKLDPINFNLLSPYTIQKMIKGRDILKELQAISGETTEEYTYQNCRIKRSALLKGIDLYNIALYKFLGNSLISRLGEREYHGVEDVRARLQPEMKTGLGEWIDLSGLIAPQSEVEKLLNDIEKGTVTLPDIQRRLEDMHARYYDYEWTWAADQLERYWGKPMAEVTYDDVVGMINLWRESVVKLDRLIYEDAKKEFNLNSRTGFGVDGDEERKHLDFESVRGSFESNPFVMEVLNHIDKKTKLGNDTIARLR